MQLLWQGFWRIVSDNKVMNWRAGIAFFLAFLVGLFVDLSNPFIKDAFDQMNEMAQDIATRDSLLYTIQMIFFNNVLVAMMMIFLGLIFGIVPFMILLFNGLFIGVFAKFFIAEGSSLIGFIAGIIPHGIFELTAIVLAGAYGLKLGGVTWRAIVNFVSGNKEDPAPNRVANGFRELGIFILGIVVLLFIAAIIESTISSTLVALLI